MNEELPGLGRGGALLAASAAALCLAAGPAGAQDASGQTSAPSQTTPSQTTPSQSTGASQTTTPARTAAPAAPNAAFAPDPNPYYVGVGQGFTHDSNVYRIPSGPGDWYSSTTLFGGFDQPISRQRVYGRAGVSLNRYQDETQLNNTSYDFSLGADLATIENITGTLNAGINQQLATPSSPGALPTATRNLETTKRAGGVLRWGGQSLLTLEGGINYVRTDYSAPEFVTSEQRETTTTLRLYYNSGAFLRVGIGVRYDDTKTPSSLLDPATGTYRPNTTDGRNLDLLLDYTIDPKLKTNAILSYTKQTNSLIATSDFSGWTGSLAVNWQPTAKSGVTFDISRVAGFEANSLTRYAVVQTGTGLTLTPIPVVYQNNRVTDSAGLGASYAATAKINAGATVRYTRARLAGVTAETLGIPQDVDVSKSASLNVGYAITRAWTASCSAAYEWREVRTLVSYSYNANVFGCATQFTWH